MASTFAIGGASQNILDNAQSILHRLQQFVIPYNSRRDKLHQHLIGWAPPRYYPDKKTPRSSVFAPYPFSNVDQIRASIMEGLFGTDPPFETLPGGSADGDSALAMQQVLERKVLLEGRLRPVFNEFLTGLCTYGFMGIDVGWDWDYDIVKSKDWLPVAPTPETPPELIGRHPQTGQPLVLDPLTGQPHMALQPVRTKVPRMRPKYTTIDIYDLLVDPDGAYIAKYFDKTFPQLLREAETARASGFDLYADDALATLQAALVSKWGDKADDAIIRIAELWDVVNGTCTLVITDDDPTVLSYKDSRFARRSGVYRTWRRTTADVNPMLLAPPYENPFNHCKVPILYTSYTKLPGEPFGMGVIEPTFNVMEALNSGIDLILDNWKVGVNQRLVVDDTRDIDFESLQENNVPMGIIAVQGDTTTALTALQAHTPTAGDYALLPMLRNLIELASSVSDFFDRGIGSSGGNDTATGISQVLAQSSKRKAGVMMNLQEDILIPLLQMTAANCQQFLTDEIEFRITDQAPVIGKVQSQFKKIRPSDLVGNFDFRLVGPLYMDNRFVMQRNIRDIAELISANPTMAQQIDARKGLEEILRIYNIPYPNRLLLTPEEVQQNEAGAQQQAMSQQMMIDQYHLLLSAVMKKAGLDPDSLKEHAKATENPQPTVGKDGKKKASGPPPKTRSADPVTGVTRAFSQAFGANAVNGGNT